MTALAPPTGPEAPRVIERRPAPRYDWRALALRARQLVVVAAALVLLVLGLTAGLRTPEAVTNVVPAPMPDRIAEAFAVRAVEVVFTFDESDPAAYRRAVVELLANPADPLLGWDGRGRSTVTGARVVTSTTDPVDNSTLVVIEARIGGQLRRVFVPVVRSASGEPTLAGVPSFGTAPNPAAQPAPASLADVDTDPAATDAAAPTIEGFFRAWGTNGADLTVYTAEGFTPDPGPGQLRLGSITYRVPTGGDTRSVLVLVRWIDTAGLAYPSAYAVTLTSTGTRWRIAGLAPAPTSAFTDLPA